MKVFLFVVLMMLSRVLSLLMLGAALIRGRFFQEICRGISILLTTIILIRQHFLLGLIRIQYQALSTLPLYLTINMGLGFLALRLESLITQLKLQVAIIMTLTFLRLLALHQELTAAVSVHQ